MLNKKHKCIIWFDSYPFSKPFNKKEFNELSKINGIHICFPQQEFSVNDISDFFKLNDKLFVFIPKINQYIQFNLTTADNKLNPVNIHYMLNQGIKYGSTNLRRIKTKQLIKNYSQVLETIDKWNIVHGDWWFLPYDLIQENTNLLSFKILGKEYLKFNIKTMLKQTRLTNSKSNNEYLIRLKILEKYDLLPPPHLSVIQEHFENLNAKQYENDYFNKQLRYQQWVFDNIQNWVENAKQYMHSIDENKNCIMATKYDELKKYKNNY